MTRPVYFVGTIGLDTASEVFGEVGERLGGHVHQVPDGEVAGRRQWMIPRMKRFHVGKRRRAFVNLLRFMLISR